MTHMVKYLVLVAVAILALAGCASAPAPGPGLLGLPATDVPLPPGARGPAEGRGFLGLTLGEAASGGLDEMADAGGLPVEAVAPNGPAELAGVRAGDVVVALDGAPARFKDAFEAREAALAPGAKVALTVRRGDAVSRVDVDAGVRRAPRPFPAPGALVEERLAGIALAGVAEPRARSLGLRAGAGVELVGFAAQSTWRDKADLEPGDVIVRARVAGEPATATARDDLFSPRELLERIARAGPGAEVELDILRGGPRVATGTARPLGPPARALRVVTQNRTPERVRDVNLAYVFRYEREPPATDVELLFYCFRFRRNPKESRVNLLWLFSFAWAGDESLTQVK
jgi:membrane-associated protease RseP (regulator of RpoE activity)